jgi:tetratricopeptide (TPR) repeat protein
MSRLALLLAAASVAAAATPRTASAAPADADEFVRCARVLLDDGKVRPAEVLINEALRLDRSRAEAYLVRGMIRARRDEAKPALDDLNQSLRLGLPGTEAPFLAYYHRGRVQSRLRNFDAADQDFDTALKFARSDQQKGGVYLARGLARDLAGRGSDALADLTAAINLVPNEPAYYLARGILYRKLGMRDRAAQDFAQAEKLL